jgi:hypothetical protein
MGTDLARLARGAEAAPQLPSREATVELERVALALTGESHVARVGPFDPRRGAIEIFLDDTFLSCQIHGREHDAVSFGAVIYLRFRLGEGKVAQRCTRPECAGRDVVCDLDEGVVARARVALGPGLAWGEVRDAGLPAEDPDAGDPHEWTAEEDVIIWAGRTTKPVKKYDVILRRSKRRVLRAVIQRRRL